MMNLLSYAFSYAIIKYRLRKKDGVIYAISNAVQRMCHCDLLRYFIYAPDAEKDQGIS